MTDATSELIRRISSDLVMPPSLVRQLMESAPRRYKVYQIPKRSGEMRTIAQPARETKLLQYWLLENFLDRVPTHPSATAYRKGIGTKETASRHQHSKVLMKLDFEAFFPSIGLRDLGRHFFEEFPAPLSAEDLRLLRRLLLWRRRGTDWLQLSIGAPTSPAVSNLVMRPFDSAVAGEARRLGLTYTRYADDLVLSGDRVESVRALAQFVVGQLAAMRQPRLRLNDRKTVLVTRGGRRKVLGIVLANDGSLSLGRERKRWLRAAAHRLVSNALAGEDVATLAGWIAYAFDVEPEFIERLSAHYKVDLVRTARESQRRASVRTGL